MKHPLDVSRSMYKHKFCQLDYGDILCHPRERDSRIWRSSVTFRYTAAAFYTVNYLGRCEPRI